MSNGASLSYDPAGKLFQTTGGSTTRLLYDGDRIIGEYDGSGNLLRRYVPGANAEETAVWYEGSGTSDKRFLVQDWAGSVIAATDAGGNPIIINRYDEAGIPGQSNGGRFQWRGQPWIPEAGLYHMRARAYSPTLGRFMQPDPIGTAGGINIYAYAGNDPVNNWDPSGLDFTVGLRGGGTRFCISDSSSSESGYTPISQCTDYDFTSQLDQLGSGGLSTYEIRSTSQSSTSTQSSSPTCPGGDRIVIPFFSPGATAFLGVGGVSVGADLLGVAIPKSFFSTGSLRGTQFYASASVTGLVGLGAFVGVGQNFGYSVSRGPLTTGSSTTPVLQGGAGWVAGGEFSASVGSFQGGLGDTSQGFQAGGSGGPRGAFGAYVAAGAKATYTVASGQFGCRP